jgi:hypothetical protein
MNMKIVRISFKYDNFFKNTLFRFIFYPLQYDTYNQLSIKI